MALTDPISTVSRVDSSTDGIATERAPWRIAVIAASVLVLELALIRLVPAEVPVISYFTNLMLMASFFGLGLGMILLPARRFPELLPIGLAIVAAFVLWARGIVIYEEATAVHYWLQYEQPRGVARSMPILPAAVLAFGKDAVTDAGTVVDTALE